uniref:Uncharacterized protein n=1 Tax=viral metagenome TaxID=1070528 RepID=A0A6M3JHC4_9ZZZZ
MEHSLNWLVVIGLLQILFLAFIFIAMVHILGALNKAIESLDEEITNDNIRRKKYKKGIRSKMEGD